MPCTPDPNCEGLLQNADQFYTVSSNITPTDSIHYANMGWVGFVFMRSSKLRANNILRVTSADLNLSQEITMPDVVDGRIDKTVYQMGPKVVEGTLSMPIVADVTDPDLFGGCPTRQDLTSSSSVAGGVLQNVWCWATARGNHGRLLFDDMNLDVRYANHAAFTFDSCVVNTLSMSVAQSDAVNVDINVLGRQRVKYDQPWLNPKISDFLAPARVLTWNDVTINAVRGCFGGNYDLFYSNQVREFSLELNNNAERFYSLNGSLFPIDVNVGKREITGSLQLLGLSERLRELAETNQNRFTEKNEIRFGFFIGDDTQPATIVPGAAPAFSSRDWKANMSTWPKTPIFGKRLTGVVFQIEEVSLTNDVFTTNVNYLALANDQENYEAVAPASSCSFPAWR